MTIILFKLFLMFAVITIVSMSTNVYELGKYGELLCTFVATSALVLFTATICSFIWFF